MKSFKNLICYSDRKISFVLKKINKNKKKFCVVIDRKTNKVEGMVTDGDLRRSFLSGKNLEDNISKAMNKKFIYSNSNSINTKLKKKLKKMQINFCPVLNKKKNLVNIIFINETLDLKKNIKVFILAGGFGRRLFPITKKIPKALVKVKDEPIILKIIKKLKSEGFDEFIISVNYMAEKIKKFLKDGKNLGVKISYVQEKKPLGTAGSLTLIDKKNLPKNLLIVNCDLYTKLKFNELVNFHFLKKVEATMCVKEKVVRQKFGIIKTKKEKIIDIKEKPIIKYFINAGIYIISSKLINLIPNKKFYLMTQLFEKILSKKIRHQVFPILEKWNDIGTLKDLRRFK